MAALAPPRSPPLLTLMLAAAGIPTLTHGGDSQCPPQYGIPLRKVWQSLGFTAGPAEPGRGTKHSLQTRKLPGLSTCPTTSPPAQALVQYRDEIGKRPPLATIELLLVSLWRQRSRR